MRPLFSIVASLLALTSASCGSGNTGGNAAFPDAVLVVVKGADLKASTKEAPVKVKWDATAKELLVQGETASGATLPAMLEGYVEVTDVPAGIYTVRMRKSDGASTGCPTSLSWQYGHGELSGLGYTQGGQACWTSGDEDLKSGEKFWFKFQGSAGEGVVLMIVAK